MTPAHRRLLAGAHRLQPRFSSRRRWISSLIILVIAVAGVVVYFYEPPPDTADAGPGYWVSEHGSDDDSGSSAHPWRTAAHAVSTAPPGSTIYLRDGTYEPFTVARKGMTITSAPKEHATIKGRSGTRDVVLITAANVTIKDVTVRGCVPVKNPDLNENGSEGSGIRVDGVSGVAVTGVVVHDSHGENAAGKPVGCFGILVTNSESTTVSGSEVYRNGAGIVVTGGGKNVVVSGNNVHDQDRIVVNTDAENDDFGGYGLGATFVKADPGPVFKDNVVRNNYGPSTDYTVDGGGIELYDAYNVTITANTFENNDGVLETGSGSKGTCSGTVFSGNIVNGGNEPKTLTGDTGMLLRCATGMVIKNNVFTDLQSFTFLLLNGDTFSGGIDDVQITGNTVTRRQDAVVYRLQIASGSPIVTIDNNKYVTGQDKFAILKGNLSEQSVTFAQWQAQTGHDSSSTLAAN